jgi:hypothetical protein
MAGRQGSITNGESSDQVGTAFRAKFPNPKFPNPKFPNPKFPNPKFPNPKFPNPKKSKK